MENHASVAVPQRPEKLPFHKYLTWNMVVMCIILALNVLSNGFDLSVYNTIQVMDCTLPCDPQAVSPSLTPSTDDG